MAINRQIHAAAVSNVNQRRSSTTGTGIGVKLKHTTIGRGASYRVRKSPKQKAHVSSFKMTDEQLEDRMEPTLADRLLSEPSMIGVEDRPPYIIQPGSPFINTWQVIGAVFIVICALFLPFQMAFQYEYMISDAPTIDQYVWTILWPSIDTYFFIDMAVNFRLAYYEGGELEQSPRLVFKNYRNTWFTIDFLSSISSPLEIIASGFGAGRNMRILKILKLTKLVRLARLVKLLDNLGELAADFKVLFSLSKLFVGVFMFAHIIGCGWWAISNMMRDDGEKSWITNYYENEADNLTISEKYWGSLYWAFITITTVGYGDITPGNDLERRYALLTTFIGTGLFAYITGEITALATSRQASHQALTSKLNAVREFMAFYKLPKKLFVAVRDYYRGSFHHSFFSTEDLVAELPIDLARQVEHSIACSKFQTNPWFRVIAIDKEHDVKLEPADAEFLRSMTAHGESSPSPHAHPSANGHLLLHSSKRNSLSVHLSQIQYKKEYWVEHLKTNDDLKIPADELFYHATSPNNAVWKKRIRKYDRSFYHNFVDETQQLFSSIVSEIETRKVEAGSMIFKKNDAASEIAILEWGEVHIVGTNQYVHTGSFMGFCDKEFTTEHNNKLVFAKSFYATTDCEFTVLQTSHLQRCLRTHGHADLNGMTSSGKFVRLANMVRIFKISKVTSIGPIDEEEIPGEPKHKSHLSALLNQVKHLGAGKKHSEDITELRHEVDALTAKLDALAAKNDAFQQKVLRALNVPVPVDTMVEQSPVTAMREEAQRRNSSPMETTANSEQRVLSKRLQSKYLAS